MFTVGLKTIWFHLQCSAECGMGVRTRGVVCLTNQVSSLPLEGCGSERPATSQVCNNGHCEQRIEWFTGPWSQVGGSRSALEDPVWISQPCETCPVNLHGLMRICFTFYFDFFALNNQINAAPWTQCSAECGPGSQQRSVVCLMRSDEGFTVMQPYECSSLERPLSQQSCNLKACGAKWYHTDWSGVRLATGASSSVFFVFPVLF